MKENLVHFQSVLRNILIPRVPGSDGHKVVRNVIMAFFYFGSNIIDFRFFYLSNKHYGMAKPVS
jgi:hypothetical protein